MNKKDLSDIVTIFEIDLRMRSLSRIYSTKSCLRVTRRVYKSRRYTDAPVELLIHFGRLNYRERLFLKKTKSTSGTYKRNIAKRSK